MPTTIKAKVSVTLNDPTQFDGIKFSENIRMIPVYSDSEENKTFSDATPSGLIQLCITNKNAWGFFVSGKEYFVDFARAERTKEEYPVPAPVALEIGFENVQGDAVGEDKLFRKQLDAILQNLKAASQRDYKGERAPGILVRSSRERSLAFTAIQEAVMWLGMDLKEINEAKPIAAREDSPYPNSYNPASPVIDPTADGLKL